MRTHIHQLATAISLLAVAAVPAQGGKAVMNPAASTSLENFDQSPVGATPPDWFATKTGSGHPKWAVEKDTSAPSQPNVLKQSGSPPIRFVSSATRT